MRTHLVGTLAVVVAAHTARFAYAQDTARVVPSIKVGGYIQARETYRSDTKLTATLNRARLSADGNLTAGFTYRVLVEYQASGTATAAASVSLRDAYIRWTRQAFSVTAGQYKTPFSPEFIMSITVVETADRATVVDSIATKRDIGVMAQYTLGGYGAVSLGVFSTEEAARRFLTSIEAKGVRGAEHGPFARDLRELIMQIREPDSEQQEEEEEARQDLSRGGP